MKELTRLLAAPVGAVGDAIHEMTCVLGASTGASGLRRSSS